MSSYSHQVRCWFHKLCVENAPHIFFSDTKICPMKKKNPRLFPTLLPHTHSLSLLTLRAWASANQRTTAPPTHNAVQQSAPPHRTGTMSFLKVISSLALGQSSSWVHYTLSGWIHRPNTPLLVSPHCLVAALHRPIRIQPEPGTHGGRSLYIYNTFLLNGYTFYWWEHRLQWEISAFHYRSNQGSDPLLYVYNVANQ